MCQSINNDSAQTEVHTEFVTEDLTHFIHKSKRHFNIPRDEKSKSEKNAEFKK